jgi:hypothetical protein
MNCRWCGESCEQEFCGPECFEEHQAAWEEYGEWWDALPEPPEVEV